MNRNRIDESRAMDEENIVGHLKGNNLLRLLALDMDDLQVISAHLQDACVKKQDLHYLPREKRFVLALHRFDWEQEDCAPPCRRLTALHFEKIIAVRHRNMEKAEDDLLFNLLAIYFLEGEKPSGAIVLEFDCGAAIRLEVECIEAQMKDLGPIWHADRRPARIEAKDQA